MKETKGQWIVDATDIANQSLQVQQQILQQLNVITRELKRIRMKLEEKDETRFS